MTEPRKHWWHRTTPNGQTLGEEWLNSVTHGIGAALATAALVILVSVAASRGDGWRVTGMSIYGVTLILLYLASTLYHSFQNPRIKRFFKTMDHSAIYLLIAGTYTPVVLGPLRGGWGWTLFGLIWGLAVTGIVLKVFLAGKLKKLSVLTYVAMGWLVVIAVRPALEILPPGLLLWLVLGGVSYTLGVAFYTARRLRYHHAIWHLFVLGGSICHFFGMLYYVAPLPQPPA